MVIKNKKTKNKTVIVSLVSILAVLTIYLGIGHSQHIWPFQKVSSKDANALQQRTVNQSPKNNNAMSKTAPANPDGDKTSNQIPVSSALTASISDLEEKNGQIIFSGQVANAATGGTCVVTFSNQNDRPVTKQVDATNKDGTALCGPLSIAATEFSYLGDWQVSFHYYENSQQATATGTITIN